jgi:hypothetical protein
MTDHGPTVWRGIRCDPTTPFDPATLERVIHDQQRWSRRWLYPWVHPASRLVVGLVRFVKVLVPIRFSAHSTMDTLCVWFLRRFVSAEAGALLMRHFVVETNLLNVVLAGAGHGRAVVKLRPMTLADLGNRAVIEHDVNVYDVLIRLSQHWPPGSTAPVDAALLDVPPLDAEWQRRRWLNLDIQTALCLMNIPFAACLTPAEYERAVHSLRLDDSLLAALATVTGDTTFLGWRRGGLSVRVDSGLDVPRAVYEHAVICEYAHERLRRHCVPARQHRPASGAVRAPVFGVTWPGVEPDPAPWR